MLYLCNAIRKNIRNGINNKINKIKLTTMEAIIKSINEQRNELIEEYTKMCRQHKLLDNDLDEVIKRKDYDENLVLAIYDEITEIRNKAHNTLLAINDLRNTLIHLGLDVDAFWG